MSDEDAIEQERKRISDAIKALDILTTDVVWTRIGPEMDGPMVKYVKEEAVIRIVEDEK